MEEEEEERSYKPREDLTHEMKRRNALSYDNYEIKSLGSVLVYHELGAFTY